MHLLIDFGFVPMTAKKWTRVLDNWKNKTADNPSRELDRQRVIQDMKDDLELKKMHFLRKRYRDGDKVRTLTTGIGKYDTFKRPDKRHLNVESLVGNPKSQQDPKFKGAIKSLKRKLRPEDTIAIEGLNPKVESEYEKGFGGQRRRWVMNKDVWKRE